MDILLSQSLVQSDNDAKSLRDPFQQARNAYESKQSQGGDVLSSSPFSPDVNNPVVENGFLKSAQAMGIDATGLGTGEIGRLQLLKRIESKFGNNFQNNPDIIKLIESYNSTNMQMDKNMNKAITNAERTIGALFGR